MIFLPCGTRAVEQPGSDCLYLQGKLKCRIICQDFRLTKYIETEQVPWSNVVSPISQFFISLSKKGRLYFLNGFGFKVLPFLLGTLQFAFCGISAVLHLLVELELSPQHESFLHL